MASCNQLLFSLAKVISYITYHVVIQIYKSIVMSKLIYGGLLHLGAPKTYFARLQKLQNRALHICYCADRYTSNINLHHDLNVLPLYLRRKINIYKCMYKLMLYFNRSEHTQEGRPWYSSSQPPIFDRPKNSWTRLCIRAQRCGQIYHRRWKTWMIRQSLTVKREK